MKNNGGMNQNDLVGRYPIDVSSSEVLVYLKVLCR